MGNLNDLSNPQQQMNDSKFLQKIQKVSEGTMPQIGNFFIYQLQQKPYDYYLQYIQAIVPTLDYTKQKLQFYMKMPKHKNIAPIEYVDIVEKKQNCATFSTIRLYCPFYNFTIEDAIKLKIKQKSSFSQPELVYILKCLLGIGMFYQKELKSCCYSGIYKSKNIFISPQGHIKLYPFNANLFSSYFDNQNKSSEFTESSKVSLQVSNSKLAPTSKDPSKSFIKKSKLTTTLNQKKQWLSSTKSQYLLGNHLQADEMSRRASQALLLNHQESQLGFMFSRNENTKQKYKQVKRDWFEIGLLMMQLILLNQAHQYYYSNKKQQTGTSISTQRIHHGQFNRSSRNQMNQTRENQNQKDIFSQYVNQNGQLPKSELIEFSLKKLLPKMNLSRVFIQMVEKLILPSYNQTYDYKQFHDSLEKFQQISSQQKYCLKFQYQQGSQQKSPSKTFMKNKTSQNSTDLLGNTKDQSSNNFSLIKQDLFNRTTNFSSVAFGESSLTSKILDKKHLQLNQSDQQISSTTKRLQDFLNNDNLTDSRVVDEANADFNSSQILDKLKKSRKLIPNKIRSISMTQQSKDLEMQRNEHIQNKLDSIQVLNSQKYRVLKY